MARKPETLSEVLQARRKRRRAAQRHFDNLAALPPDAIDPLSMLPSDAYDSLQARLKKSAAQPDCGVWVDKLTLDQQRALAALKKAADALNEAAAARDESDLLPEEVAEDEPLRKLIARRDRAVRRVIKLGLERHSDAISIVRAWLAHPHRTVPKGSRERLGVSRAKGQRKDMTLEDV